MVKMKKYQLVFEQEFDFDMIGISSHHNDYRLVWSINSELGLHFERSNEPYIMNVNKKGLKVGFIMYEFHDDENKVDYWLVKNKEAGHFLIPERPSIDYFIFIMERESINMEDFGNQLRNVSSILAVFPFEPEELDSTENLVFI